MQRFSMMVWPVQTGEWIDVDHWPDGAAKKAAWAVFDRLDTLDPQAIGATQDTDLDGNPEGAPYLRLSEAALALFVQWRTDLEARLRRGEMHPAMESHLSKYRKLVPALALICHLADDGSGPVSEAAMLRALGWATYLESHARRIYGGAVSPEAEAARAILRRIKRGDLARDGFSGRDAYINQWSGLSDRDLVSAALAYLVEMDWLHERREPTAGRPSTTYTLNGRAKL
jgi:putative DNA primase/helicase